MKTQFTHDEWNTYAQSYDVLHTLVPYQKLLSAVGAALAIADGNEVLDAGCGTGNLLQSLVHQYPNATYSGADSAPSMLTRAEIKCTNWPVTFYNVDLTKRLPFTDSQFDKIAAVNVLYTLPNPRETLREMHRIIASNGTLVLVTPKWGYENGYVLKEHCQSSQPDTFWKDAHASPEREAYLINLAIDNTRTVQQMLQIAAHNRRIALTTNFTFFTEASLTDALTQSGFSIKTMSYVYANQALMVTAKKEPSTC